MKASEEKKAIRDALMAERIKRPMSKRITIADGVEAELRQPTVRQRDEIFAAAGMVVGASGGMRVGRMAVEACIACLYVPGTNEHVFDEEDRDTLLGMAAGGFVQEVGTDVVSWATEVAPALGKASATTGSVDSSSSSPGNSAAPSQN